MMYSIILQLLPLLNLRALCKNVNVILHWSIMLYEFIGVQHRSLVKQRWMMKQQYIGTITSKRFRQHSLYYSGTHQSPHPSALLVSYSTQEHIQYACRFTTWCSIMKFIIHLRFTTLLNCNCRPTTRLQMEIGHLKRFGGLKLNNTGWLLTGFVFTFQEYDITQCANKLLKLGMHTSELITNDQNGCTVVSLSRAATGESWQLIMMDCATPNANCDRDSDNQGQKCGSAFAYPYFISFYIICSFLVRFCSIAFVGNYYAGVSDISCGHY